jgi:preprotein translocase subunit SecG
MGQQILLIVHILLAIGIIGLILLQHGKGAEVGAAFGSGASQTLFGSRGATSFLAKLTAVFALGFAITSISIGYMATHRNAPKSILEEIEKVQKAEEIPALPTEEADTSKVNTSDVVSKENVKNDVKNNKEKSGVKTKRKKSKLSQ